MPKRYSVAFTRTVTVGTASKGEWSIVEKDEHKATTIASVRSSNAGDAREMLAIELRAAGVDNVTAMELLGDVNDQAM